MCDEWNKLNGPYKMDLDGLSDMQENSEENEGKDKEAIRNMILRN
jgi:hypothetical protein